MTDDERAAADVSRAWLVANRTGDTGWLRENLGPDYTMHNLNGSDYIGVDHIVSLWEYYSEGMEGWGKLPGDPVQVEMTGEPVVRVSGDMALVSYRGRFKGVSADYGGDFDVDFRGTDVLERIDGRWKIQHGHYSPATPGGHAGGI